MAQKITIELDLEKGEVKGAVEAIEEAAEQAGESAAKKFAKSFDKFNKKAGGSIASIAGAGAKATAAVAGLGAALATAIGIKGVQAAQVQEDAINRLNTALQLSGDFSDQASKDLQAYASELQNATRFGDELVLNQLALAKSFGATNEQAKQIVSAATDLSASFGIDLESATRNVAKTLGGFAGELGEVIPELKNLDQAQLQAGEGIGLLAKRFAGAASRDVLTFSGQIEQLSNTVGDLFEEIGFLITQNPKFVQLFKSLTDAFSDAGTEVKGFASSFDAFDFITSKLIGFNNAVITNIIAPLELVKNVGSIVFDGLVFAVDSAVKEFAEFGLALSTFLNKFGLESDAQVEKYKNLVASTTEVTEQAAAKLDSSLDNVFTFSIADKLSQENEKLDMFFTGVSEKATNAGKAFNDNQTAIVAKTQENLIGLTGIFSEVGSAFETQTGKVQDSVKKINEDVKKFASDSGKSLRTGLAQGAGRAFAEFGRALVEGENALEAFTRSFLKSIGEQAVALGTRFILEGVAYLFVPGKQALGAPLIKAGAALAAFGGALGAASSGGGSDSGGGSAPAVSGTDQAIADTNQELASPEEITAEERVNLNLNVEGSLVRESELNGYITNLLEEGSSRDANIVPSLVTS